MRKSIVDRDILPALKSRLLNEIGADDLRALCNKVKARGAPATAVHVRDIAKQVYAFAILRFVALHTCAAGSNVAEQHGCASAERIGPSHYAGLSVDNLAIHPHTGETSNETKLTLNLRNDVWNTPSP